ncbi:unnamed protein product [Cylindrotheca closterium]|uniref:Uncharacterized protein n=1 Tax=Cylindrotheca closterium TaxID=2856 RepID=A0AAD2FLW4_9STRA|nr:unnamed protein product [Cylindrotheca closterium]
MSKNQDGAYRTPARGRKSAIDRLTPPMPPSKKPRFDHSPSNKGLQLHPPILQPSILCAKQVSVLCNLSPPPKLNLKMRRSERVTPSSFATKFPITKLFSNDLC